MSNDAVLSSLDRFSYLSRDLRCYILCAISTGDHIRFGIRQLAKTIPN